MPVAPKRTVGSSEPSAYERFHSTFQAAVTQELEALVGDLRSAAARVADQPVNLSDPPRGDGAEDASGSLKALVDELDFDEDDVARELRSIARIKPALEQRMSS